MITVFGSINLDVIFRAEALSRPAASLSTCVGSQNSLPDARETDAALLRLAAN